MSVEEGVVRAAGGLIWRRNERGAIELVLVHRPRYDDWTLPKGKLERGETEEQGALREVEEETGLRCKLGGGLGTTTYHDSRGRTKIVHYWEMTAVGGEFVPSHEVDETRWVALDEAPATLSYDRDRDILSRFGAPAAVHVHLLRHAKARNRRRWKDEDHLRPLSKAGRRQSKALVDQFADEPLARLVSSPFVRCVETLEPLAAARSMAIETADELAEGADGDDALALIRSVGAGGPAVLCTHGDVMQLAVHGLAAAGVPLADGGLFDLGKGSTWVVEVAGAELTGAHYVPPPKT